MTAIDISRYQGVIDFEAVKASGVQLVIAKQGGADSGLYTDSKYLVNRAGIRAAGLPLGSYFFNGPAASPAKCADYMFDGMDYHPGELAVIDVEGSGLAWSPDQVLAWIEQMLAHGVRVADLGIYMSASPEHTGSWGAVAETGVFLWVASYGTNNGTPGTPPRPTHWPSWSLWQYTSTASCPGIPGRVDTSMLASGWAPFIITPKEEETDMPKIVYRDPTPTNGLKARTIIRYDGSHKDVTSDGDLANSWAYSDLTPVGTGARKINEADKLDVAFWNWLVAAPLPSFASVPGAPTDAQMVNAQVDVTPELITALKDPTVLAALSAAIKVPTKIESTLS